ncbi:MAG: ATPase P [Deltaproteobacteria bacterium]|nr:MAG: ATPase P [Deltaproteobacteria bacterium]
MIKIEIPGFGKLVLAHVVFDYNGTLAVDGEVIAGVKTALRSLADRLTIHILTADTFGKVKSRLSDLPCEISILPPGEQDVGKRDFIQSLGAEKTVAMGNGRNDRLMLQAAALGIAVILGEGASAQTLSMADVVCTDILDALALLENPLRLVATLRS